MYMRNGKIKLLALSIFSFIMICTFMVYAKSVKDDNYKREVLITIGVIDDTDNLDKYVTRSEFAKLIVKASPKSMISENSDILSTINDVENNDKNISYIKIALDNNYMFSYLGGLFKPGEYVSYSDVCRACLSILGYKNDDFSGNRVNAYNNKFSELKLNDYIEKSYTDYLTKGDICNAIYNTLKENIKDSDKVYGPSNFIELTLDTDNELIAYDKNKDTIYGPIVVKDVDSLKQFMELDDYELFLNGIRSTYNELIYDIENYNFAAIYYNDSRKLVYAYTERVDVDSPLAIKKGYVVNVEYEASDMLMPYRVNISDNFYYLASEEMKFEFSYAGNIKIGDYIYFLTNKYNDKSKAYIDKDKKYHNDNDDAVIYVGSIVTVYNLN